jgi:hypothetical protein
MSFFPRLFRLTPRSNRVYQFEAEGDGAGGVNYSTSEVDTGLKWIDGKPIFQKVVNFGAMPNATNKQVNHNIVGLDYLISAQVMAKSNTGTFRPLPYVDHVLVDDVTLEANVNVVAIITYANYSDHTAIWILRYTKT